MVGAKDAVLVAVESHRLAVADKVAASGLEIVEGRLGHDETQLHEFAGGVADVDQEGTLGPAVLEPVVFAAVDLDQLAEAFPTIPRLVRSGSALCAGLPNASLSVRHERGCFSSDGNFPTSRYLAAVFGSSPARAAARPSLPCLLDSSISFLTCASVAATQALLVWAASCYGVTQDREK